MCSDRTGSPPGATPPISKLPADQGRRGILFAVAPRSRIVKR
jgi:hypothetical protein